MQKEIIFKVFGIRNPSARDLEATGYIVQYMKDYSIDTLLRQAMYLAQVGHESGRLRYLEEIASGKAYEGRSDLGNVHKGDGVRYKGRGLIQVTGRYNYQRCGQWLGIDLISQPELLATPEWAVKSSIWFWVVHNLNAYADRDDLKGCTGIINGGYNGLEDREELYVRAINLLSQEDDL